MLDFDHFARRVIQDALNEATSDYWQRRADAFEAAIHRPSDFAGLCSVEQIAEVNERLALKAKLCRFHATICEFQDFAELYEAIVAEHDEHREAA